MGGSVLSLCLVALSFEEVYVERIVNLGFCNDKHINKFICKYFLEVIKFVSNAIYI